MIIILVNVTEKEKNQTAAKINQHKILLVMIAVKLKNVDKSTLNIIVESVLIKTAITLHHLVQTESYFFMAPNYNGLKVSDKMVFSQVKTDDLVQEYILLRIKMKQLELLKDGEQRLVFLNVD